MAAHSNAVVVLDNTGMEMINQAHFAADIIRRRLGKLIHICINFIDPLLPLFLHAEHHCTGCLCLLHFFLSFSLLCHLHHGFFMSFLHCACDPSAHDHMNAYGFPTHLCAEQFT